MNLRRWLLEPERPILVVEVRPTSLGVASLAKGGGARGLGAAASLDLPDGTLRLSLSQPNIAEPEAFDRVLRALLERTGLQGRRRVGLVLPDPTARVSLISPSELAEKGTPVPDLIRFRLKKSLPFDVREAQIAHLAGGPFHLAVAMSQDVLRNYEEALARVGLEVGLVELSGLALAEAAGAGAGDFLFLNWEPGYLSLFLLRSGWPILVRTLTGPSSEVGNIAQEVTQTLVYSRERLEGNGLGGAAIRCPAPVLGEALDRLQGVVEVPLRAIDPWALVGGGPRELASDTGLAGALACLRRAVA